jgi:hypothetical protein
MRIFLKVLILIFSLQSWTKANDISDFEIEGMSIGDSLLDHYSEEEINNAIEIYNYPGGNEFIYYFLLKKNYEKYKYVQVHVKPLDKNFIVESIEGHIFYKKNISKCYDQMKIVKKDLESELKIQGKEDNGNHSIDVSGKSTYKRIMFYFSNGDYVEAVCYDMSKKFEENGKYDRFIVALSTKEFLDFLSRAY